jgi:hypothetical protein
MRVRLAVIACVVAALWVGPVFAGAEFHLPDPPQYAPAGAGVDPLTQLRDTKVAWLKKKIGAEESWIRTLERRKEMEGIDKEAVDKDIHSFRDAIAHDQGDIDALTEKDALKPDKNTDAGKHAKLIKKNVQEWLTTLEAKERSAHAEANKAKGAEAEKARAEAKRISDNAQALEGDLKEAEKTAPKLFE